MPSPKRSGIRLPAQAETLDSQADGRRRRGDRSREAVLAQATSLASTEGLEGLTLGRLAKAAAVGKSNLQALFGDKEALQLATFDAATNIFIHHVIAPARTRRSPRAQLLAYCDGWFDYVERRVLPGGCMMYAATHEYRTRPGPIQARVGRTRDSWRDLLLATTKAAVAKGEFSSACDPRQLVFEIMAFQAAANVAAVSGDVQLLTRARRSVRARLRDAAFMEKA